MTSCIQTTWYVLASRCRARSRALWLEDVAVDDVIANGLIRTRIRILSCAIDQWRGGVFEIMLRRIQGRPRWSRAAGPEGNTGERSASFFRFRERVGIHTSAQHVTTSSSLEERGMRDHTMCCRLSYIIRSRMPRMCDDGCIGRGRELRQLAPLTTLGVRMHCRGTAAATGVCGRNGWGGYCWTGWVQYPFPHGGSQHDGDDMWTCVSAERSSSSALGPGEVGSTTWD